MIDSAARPIGAALDARRGDRRRPARRCTARTWRACPTRTSRCSWGRPARSTRRRWPRGCCSDGRGGYCFELNTVLAALLRACGFVVTHHQAVVGGEGPTNHMVLLVRLDGERWLADAGLGEGFLEPLPFREGATTIGPFAYTLTREDGGTWWMGQHEWGSFSGFRMAEEASSVADFEAHHRRLATDPESSLRARRSWSRSPRPTGSSRCARARCRRSARRSTRSAWSRTATSSRAVLRDEFGIDVGGRAARAPVDAGRGAARSVPGARLMQVATHPGNFHADDVFAVAVLGLVHGAARDRPHPRRRAGRGRRRPRRHRRALRSRGRRLRPPPARRRRRARQRHPLRELRPRLARVRRAAGGRRRRPRRRSTSGSSRASTPTTPARRSATALVEGIRPMTVSGVIAGDEPALGRGADRGGGGRAVRRGGRAGHGILERELARREGLPARPGPRARARSSAPATRASSSSTASCPGTRRS